MSSISISSTDSTSIPKLENYLSTLNSLLHSISITRYQNFPNLINNLQGPIQNVTHHDRQKDSFDFGQVIQTWRTDTQNVLNDLQNLRTQIANSQEVMKYVRTSSKLDSKLTNEERSAAIKETNLISQKIKQNNIKSKSKSSSSNRTKSITLVDKQIIYDELAKRKKLKKLKSQLVFPRSTIKFDNLQDCVDQFNQLNQSLDLFKFVSDHQILLNDVMNVILIIRKNQSQDTIIERVFCFGLNEPQHIRVMIYERSSFALIRSINRCINSIINEHLRSDSGKSSSNLWLVFSLLSSYKDFFKLNLTKPLESESTSKQTTNPLAPGMHHHLNNSIQPSQQPVSRPTIASAAVATQDGHDGSLLTWRRWKFHPRYLLELLDKDPEDLPTERLSEDLNQIANQGQWVNIRETN